MQTNLTPSRALGTKATAQTKESLAANHDLASKSPRGKAALVASLIVLSVLITPIIAASFGAASISAADVLGLMFYKLFGSVLGIEQPSHIVSRIVFDIRLPRILLALIAGAGLAVSGSVLQTVTRNPLADPFLFGISSGASLGAVVTLSLFGASVSWLSLPLGAFIGASLAVIMVLGLVGTGVTSQTERMLLSGVAISFMFAALTSLILYFSDPQATASVLFWNMGSFAKASWQGLVVPALVVGIGIGLVLVFKLRILAMLAGDETAHTLGIPVVKLRLGMLLLCSLITATLVANCGGIGFVGLMIPHIIRMLLPGGYPVMIIALTGGLFMVWVDVVARSLMQNQELPVGIITSVIGSIFFLLVLKRR